MTRCFHCGQDSTYEMELKDIDLEDMSGMDGRHCDSRVECALNKLGLVRDRIAELKEQHEQRLKELLMKRKEVIKYIPKFWITAFKNSSSLGCYFCEYEDYINKRMFSYLDFPTVVDDADGLGGYDIDFVFHENPYFENDVISISVTIGNSAPHCSASPIRWKCVDKSLLRWLTEDSPEENEDDRLKKIETAGEIRSVIKSPLEYYMWSDGLEPNAENPRSLSECSVDDEDF